MIAIGCDHGGYELKLAVESYLNDCKIEFVDCGCDGEKVDYPDIAEKVEMAANLVGMFTKDDSTAVFDNLANLLSGGEVDDSSFFASIQIRVEEITVNEDAATVSAQITYRLLKDDTVRPATFECICEDGQWYISGFQFQ